MNTGTCSSNLKGMSKESDRAYADGYNAGFRHGKQSRHPAVAADARELVDRCAVNTERSEANERVFVTAAYDTLVERITDYANQRGEQRYREGIEAALTAMTWPYSDGDGLRNVDPRAIEQARALLLNQPADKSGG